MQVRSSLTSVAIAIGDQQQHERKPVRRRDAQRIERRCGVENSDPDRRPRDAVAHPVQRRRKILAQPRHDLPAAPKHHEVIVGKHLEFGLRDDALVLAGRRRGDEWIGVSVEDQHRRFETLEDATEWALVGVVEVSRVGPSEERIVEQAEMRQALLGESDGSQLDAVNQVIDAVVPEELEFLDADRGQQRQRCDSLGSQAIKFETDAAAHAETDEMGAIDIQTVQQVEAVHGVGSDRVIRHRVRRRPETGQIRCDQAEAIAQPGCDVAKIV